MYPIAIYIYRNLVEGCYISKLNVHIMLFNAKGTAISTKSSCKVRSWIVALGYAGAFCLFSYLVWGSYHRRRHIICHTHPGVITSIRISPCCHTYLHHSALPSCFNWLLYLAPPVNVVRFSPPFLVPQHHILQGGREGESSHSHEMRAQLQRDPWLGASHWTM